MKYIKVYKLMMIAITISLVNAESLDGQIITGKVIQVNEDVVQVEVVNSDKIQIEDKVNIYYKTSHGTEMKIGEWKVTNIENSTVKAVASYSDIPPKVGMLSKIVLSPKKEKIEVIRQDHHNAPPIPPKEDIQRDHSSVAIDSQTYVDKAKKMADDFYNDQKKYSKVEANNYWNQIIDNINKAISLGNAEAYWLLAMVYEDGYGDIQADLKKMIDNIIKSAEHGYVEAQYMLGEMYEDGDEVMKDKDQAIYWYKKAVAQGHKQAKRALDKLMINPVDIPVQLRGKEPLNYGFGKKDNLHDLLDIEK